MLCVDVAETRPLSAVRTYPASGSSVMLPLTPANNYTATILFCGGSNMQPEQWVTDWNIAGYPADKSCVTIKPDDPAPKWKDDATLPEARTMVSAFAYTFVSASP